VLLVVVVVSALAIPPLSASGALGPLNDLLSLGQGGGQEPAKAPVQSNPEPALTATPRAHCGAGSRR